MAGFTILDRPDIGAVLFHPRPDPGYDPPPPGIFNVRIPVGGDVAVAGRIYPAAADAPVLLYFHGNGEIASDYDGIAPLYLRQGITLFVVDYRGYGASDGSPGASTLLADAVAVYEQAGYLLAQRGLSYPDLFVMGRSLGSAAAIEVARHAGADIGGLIIESGFAYTFDLIERLSGLAVPGADENRDGFGNLIKIATVKVPTTIIHGQMDWIIPVGDGHALRAASAATRKDMVVIPGAGHNDLMMGGMMAYFAAVRRLVHDGSRDLPRP